MTLEMNKEAEVRGYPELEHRTALIEAEENALRNKNCLHSCADVSKSPILANDDIFVFSAFLAAVTEDENPCDNESRNLSQAEAAPAAASKPNQWLRSPGTRRK